MKKKEFVIGRVSFRRWAYFSFHESGLGWAGLIAQFTDNDVSSNQRSLGRTNRTERNKQRWFSSRSSRFPVLFSFFVWTFFLHNILSKWLFVKVALDNKVRGKNVVWLLTKTSSKPESDTRKGWDCPSAAVAYRLWQQSCRVTAAKMLHFLWFHANFMTAKRQDVVNSKLLNSLFYYFPLHFHSAEVRISLR